MDKICMRIIMTTFGTVVTVGEGKVSAIREEIQEKLNHFHVYSLKNIKSEAIMSRVVT